MRFYQTAGGHCYQEYKNGTKKRISQDKYNKMTPNSKNYKSKSKGGVKNNNKPNRQFEGFQLINKSSNKNNNNNNNSNNTNINGITFHKMTNNGLGKLPANVMERRRNNKNKQLAKKEYNNGIGRMARPHNQFSKKLTSQRVEEYKILQKRIAKEGNNYNNL